MSRDSQDIPIRPRYGLEYVADNNEKPKLRKSTNHSTGTHVNHTANSMDEMASSYSEIPFLAQLPVQVKQTQEKNETTAEDSNPNEVDELVESPVDNEDEDDDSEHKLNLSDASQTKTIQQQRPKSLQYDSSFPYELESSTSTDGQMRHFVAENLEEQLRNAPFKRDQLAYSSHNSTPSTSTAGILLTRHYLQTQVPQIDANALSDIELEAQYLAASVDNLLENLCNLLHSISSITADNVEVHRSAVNKLTDSMDANIKCMYTIMAKTEEITKAMKPTEQLGQRIREIKRLVDMLDATM